jgi:hypothetical protein
MRLLVLQCGEAKNPGLLPAAAKYKNRFHRMTAKFMETSNDWHWLIMSGAYGLVRPDELLDDYSMKLKTSQEIRDWIEKHTPGAREKVTAHTYEEPPVFVGSFTYFYALRHALRGLPLDNLSPYNKGCGEQFSDLKRLLNAPL